MTPRLGDVRTGRLWWVVGAVVIAAELMLIGASLVVESVAILVLGQVLVLPSLGLVALAARYLTLRAEQRRDETERRSEAERRRVADAVHDLVGHDLSLIAMQAGVLELGNAGPTAALAAEIRQRAEAAVITLHETTELIGAGPPVEPATDDLHRIVAEHRQAGADITVSGSLPELDAPSRVLLASVVREGLTNAARHAPGHPVEISLTTSGDGEARIDIVTRGAASGVETPRRGGLVALEHRLESLGGQLEVGVDDEGHRVLARLGPRQPAHDDDTRAHTHARRLARDVGAPLVGAVLLVVGLYTWACLGATIEPADQASIRIGMTTQELAPLVPRHEARVRLLGAPQAPDSWTCRQYTDGNFPTGMATLEVCTEGSSVVRVTDLTREPLW